MDTLSHFSMGAGIAAVATMNPAVSESTNIELFFLAVILASNLPDIDVITRVFGAKKFLTLHRGPTHSLFVSIPAAIFLGLWMSSWAPDINQVLFVSTIVIAVLCHLLTDLTNNYGVALGIPFISKWYRLSITNTSDAIVLISHLVALPLFFLLRSWGVSIAWIPLVSVYSIFVFYLMYATVYKILASYRVKDHYKKDSALEDVYILSKTSPRAWKYIAVFKKEYKVGFVIGSNINEIRVIKKSEPVSPKIVDIVKHDPIWRHFQHFSPIHTIKQNKIDGVNYVFLRDLRYFDKNGKFSFIVNIAYNKEGLTKSKLTWTKNKDKRLIKI